MRLGSCGTWSACGAPQRADNLIELKTICHCGRKATMNLRTNAEGKAIKHGAQVEIGGNERYVAMCRKHFREAMA